MNATTGYAPSYQRCVATASLCTQLEAQRRALEAAGGADPERAAAVKAARERAALLRAQAGEEALRMAAAALASTTFTVRRALSWLCQRW